MYRYLFGPVPSRRLGMSLGIDLVPMKTCSLDCIYCECGKTTHLTIDRREYVPFKEVCRELQDYLTTHSPPDYVTFSGSGEPMLYNRIRDVLAFLKKEHPYIPVALLTNGTLFTDPRIRREILYVDVLLPSLDAATQKTFQRINRPHPDLRIDEIVKGLEDLRREYSGAIWLEVFILPEVNDSSAELSALKNAILKIEPERIQLNTLDRPGTVTSIRAAGYQALRQIRDDWQLPNVEIVARPKTRKHVQAFRQDIESAILETIARRPCTLQDLSRILGLHTNELNKYLSVLETDQKIITRRHQRGVFYVTNLTREND
ncbi:radical SAM protein [candidate division KSB1 bacterium]|nr:radical SAM protein [candidate division KSB1 bacterium]